MVAHPDFVRAGQHLHPYIVVAVFQKFRARRNIPIGLKKRKNLLPRMLAPAIVQQYRFNEVCIQKRRKLCLSIVLHRIDCGLCLRLFVRIVPINAKAHVRIGIINSGTIIGKAICFHRSGHIALRRSLCFFQRRIVQLIIKAVFKVMIGGNMI